MLDKWTEYLEIGGQIDVIYTDFEKAFDKVSHARLVSKLKSYGITKTLIDWITDFLHQRKHRVKVNCSYSDWERVTSGIPQGSVLGPFPFLIYINDLKDCCEIYSEIYLFADDAKLFRHILQSSDNILLQSGLNKLRDWTRHWLLSVLLI